jgi:hypothetical protein
LPKSQVDRSHKLNGVSYEDETKKPALLTEDAMRLGLAVGGVGLGVAGAGWYFDRQRKKELEARLEKAKKEYSTILGRSLSSNQSSSLKLGEIQIYAEACPTIAGFFDILARQQMPADYQKNAAGENDPQPNWFTHSVGVPATLLTLSGIITHKWLYDRLKQKEKNDAVKMPQPPREIRIVTKPRSTTPINEADVVTPEDANPGKVAVGSGNPLDDVLSGMGIGNHAVAAIVPGDSSGASMAKKNERVDPTMAPIKMMQTAPGSLAAVTSGGPVSIEAEDPNAARVLARNKGKIKKILAMLQADPVNDQIAA